MTIAYERLIEDEEITEDENGRVARYSLVLDKVEGGPVLALANALADEKVPPRGDPHPIYDDLVLTNISGTMVDKAIAKIVLTFSRPNETTDEPYDPNAAAEERGIIQISTTTAEVETNFDVEGNPLLVTYTGTLLDSDGNEVEVEDDEQIATVNVPQKQTLFRFQRRETGPADDQQRIFGNTVNRFRIGKYSAGTLYCLGIESESEDGGVTYTVEYQFQHDPSGWLQDVVYIDPETDRPPNDVSRRNGIAEYRFFERTDFGRLRLPWPA